MAKMNLLRVSAGVVAAVLAVLLLVIASSKPVEAAFPGTNGRIFYEHNGRIWSMNSDGTGQTELVGTNDNNYELQPAVSPDGTKIAYVYGHDIWVMNADGTNPRQLTNQRTTVADDHLTPTWSPDGGKIIFSRNEDGFSTDTDIWVMNADGSGQMNLTNTPNNQELEPAWSPDASEIAYERYGCEDASGYGVCIYKMKADGSGQRNLTTDGETKICQEGGAIDHTLRSRRPSWSPDSSKIAFEGSTSCGAGSGTNIWLMNRNGGEKRDLIQDNGTNDLHPSFSPDGQKITFMSNRVGTPFGDYEIYVIDANGVQPLAGLQRLTRDEGVDDEYPDWQPIPRAGGSSSTYGPVGDSVTVKVPENGILTSSGSRTPWVDTGKTLQPGQSVEIKADPFYTIWAGVWFTGRNGPAGWDRCDSDPKFPLTKYTGLCSRPYSLIGRLNGRYFYVGETKDLKYDWGNTSARLDLRINDDIVNNGSGYFKAGITVYQGNKCVRISSDQLHCSI